MLFNLILNLHMESDGRMVRMKKANTLYQVGG
jgi:hypothetical protein